MLPQVKTLVFVMENGEVVSATVDKVKLHQLKPGWSVLGVLLSETELCPLMYFNLNLSIPTAEETEANQPTMEPLLTPSNPGMTVPDAIASQSNPPSADAPIKRKRGRPRKNPLPA